MKRLHRFAQHPHWEIHEHENEPEEQQNDKPVLDAHRQESGDLTGYSVSLDDEPTLIIKLNNKTGSVHAYMTKRFSSDSIMTDYDPYRFEDEGPIIMDSLPDAGTWKWFFRQEEEPLLP